MIKKDVAWLKAKTMDIQSTKIELARLILELENPMLIEKIKDLLIKEASNFQTNLSEQEKYEIKLGLDQLNSGQRVSFESFLKRVS